MAGKDIQPGENRNGRHDGTGLDAGLTAEPVGGILEASTKVRLGDRVYE